MIGTVSIGLITGLMTICGMASLVNFHNCDPLQNPNDKITRAEQIIPYLIQTQYPRFNGLFLSAIISATMSTMSSGLNSLTTVIILELQNINQIQFNNFTKNLHQVSQFITVVLSISISAVAMLIPRLSVGIIHVIYLPNFLNNI